jgi:hypothetical protein
MLRRAGAFAAPRQPLPFVPERSDSEAVLESKWSKWAERESYKRQVLFFFPNCDSLLTDTLDLFFTSSFTIFMPQLPFRNLPKLLSRNSNLTFPRLEISGWQNQPHLGAISTSLHSRLQHHQASSKQCTIPKFYSNTQLK